MTIAEEKKENTPYLAPFSKEVSFQSPSANTIRQIIQELRHTTEVDGRLGVSFYSLKNNKYIYRSNDTSFYTPASTLKLLVTATTLHTIPKEYYPQTKLEFYGTLDSSTQTFYGNIHIVGEGDPNVSARFAPNNLSLLDSMVKSIKDIGIRHIRGNIVPVDTFFSGPKKPMYWKKSHFNNWYGAQVSALSYNDNCFYVTVSPAQKIGSLAIVSIDPNVGYTEVKNHIRVVSGKEQNIQYSLPSNQNKIILKGSIGIHARPFSKDLPVRDPTHYFIHAFRHRLEQASISAIPSITADSLSVQQNLSLFQAKTFQTVPTTTVLQTVNQNSQNLHAETLLRILGKYHHGIGSAEKGILAEKQFLNKLGLDSSDFKLYDGSGLSHKNKVRGVALTQLLVTMAKSPYAKEYIQSLATPGVHGIKKVRLKHFRQKLKMKTGYIDPVQGLCGYLFTSEKDTLAFCVFLNDYTVPKIQAEAFVDSLVSRVSNWYNREEPSLQYAKKLYSKSLPTNYQDRLLYFSQALEGKPYKLGPTGEGVEGTIEAKPLLNLLEFDCVTYIESVMALSMSSNSDQVIPHLNKIRYFSDSISYPTRKHFFIEDWVYKSPEYVQTIRFPGDTTHIREIGKQLFFDLKKLPFLEKNPNTSLSYVPYHKALKLIDNWDEYKPYKPFLGVAFVSYKPKWIWVSHTGFLESTENGKLKLRHASSKSKKVVAQDFREYLLNRKGKVLGVYFFEFKTPKHWKNNL